MARIPTPLVTIPNVIFPPAGNDFEALVADAIGSGFVDDDGDDAVILTTAQALDSDSNSLGELDQHLADASFVAGEFEGANISPVVGDVAQVISDGGPLLDGLLSDLPKDSGNGTN